MPETMSISAYCPPMRIFKTADPRVRVTDAEPMTVTLLTINRTMVVSPVTIPETKVHKRGMLNWLVDPCVGEGATDYAGVRIELPEEPVLWRWRKLTMVAVAIDALATVHLADNSVWRGIIRFPDCPLELWSMTATEITATGNLERIV